MQTLLERITINNILAFMIVLGYVVMWSWTLYLGLLEIVPDGETRLGVVLDSVESMAGILSTMTVIVVLVVQYHFRKAKGESDEQTP
jgi:hypothetical protein